MVVSIQACTLALDFPVVEDIASFTKLMNLLLEGRFFLLYVEFLAQERNSYMHGDGIIEDDEVVDLNKCFLKQAPKK